MEGAVVHRLDERRTRTAALAADVDILTTALGEAWQLVRALERRNSRLKGEMWAVELERDRWAQEWSNLHHLLADELSDRQQRLKRECCFCGAEYLGSSRACPSHLYLLLLDHEIVDATPDDDLLADLTVPLSGRKGGL